MNAEIISIGDELLIGKTINTNAAWIGEQLGLIGIVVKWNQVIQDEEQAIRGALDLAFERSELVLMTGGLGPTQDDITKKVLCDYFETRLVLKEEVLERIEMIFRHKNRPMLEVNRQQAELPESCQVLPNRFGTASGMWFEKNERILISMPGVPYEMEGIMEEHALPAIGEYFQTRPLYHRTILTTGIGESSLAHIMSDWEDRLRAQGLGLAYLPATGMVKLRLTSERGNDDAVLIDELFQELKDRLPQYTYGYEQDDLSTVVGSILKEKGKTISTVESCSGGALAKEFVSVSGASNYFLGGLFTYTIDLKARLAGVDPEIVKQYGEVSEETAKAMAQGGRERIGSDYCLSTTGFLGPEGGDEFAENGTVWVGLASSEGVKAFRFHFGDTRERNMRATVLSAVNLLRCELLGIPFRTSKKNENNTKKSGQ
ncbi:MAG: competence/damage-inducible protein A [Bacteroidetes bacterium]|nr:MAG: competence/damage-inducible protein A [Bacteroidota bacterium]